MKPKPAWLREDLSCLGKARFATAGEAHARLRHLAGKFRGRDPRGKFKAYRCEFCRSYHVGHEPRRGGKR